MGLVYRIETENGRGAYRGCQRWSVGYPGDMVAHPGPFEDSGIRGYWRGLKEIAQARHFFGFRDEAQLRAWFYRDEWMEDMAKVGLRLTVWEVEEGFYCYGRAQAVFRKDLAKLIETRELA